ncbi:MAG: glycosyltransferase family 2 protein [Hydrogenophaga sp.]|nr:glycosyltransferase family 2 protein [Hydrogenophaga sp.]
MAEPLAIAVSPPTLGVVVLTFNEAPRIEACLRSAAFASQIVVVDSGSTDGTAELAQSLGAQVQIYADWQGFGVQRTRAIGHLRTDYVFFLDADEEISSELQAEISKSVSSGALSRMKPRGGIQRLFRRETLLGFEGVVHEAPQLLHAVPIRRFRHRLLHHSRSTVYGSLRKLAQYVQLGATKRRTQGKKGGVLRGLLMGSVVFLRVYVFQRAVLCGGPGFLYSLFIALETFFRYAAVQYDVSSPYEFMQR